jgi:hypothetical protein
MSDFGKSRLNYLKQIISETIAGLAKYFQSLGINFGFDYIVLEVLTEVTMMWDVTPCSVITMLAVCFLLFASKA